MKRLLKRGETSGREDDNEESIKKRFRECHWPAMRHSLAELPHFRYLP